MKKTLRHQPKPLHSSVHTWTQAHKSLWALWVEPPKAEPSKWGPLSGAIPGRAKWGKGREHSSVWAKVSPGKDCRRAKCLDTNPCTTSDSCFQFAFSEFYSQARFQGPQLVLRVLGISRGPANAICLAPGPSLLVTATSYFTARVWLHLGVPYLKRQTYF